MLSVVWFWERRIACVGDQYFESRSFEPWRRLTEHLGERWLLLRRRGNQITTPSGPIRALLCLTTKSKVHTL